MKLVALLYFALSLLGIDIGGNTYVHHRVADGAETLYSRATAQAGVARFECLRSASGRCYYTVLPRDCAAGANCTSRPLERFALASGDSRQITGLQGFRLCVSAEAGAPDPECQTPEPMTTQ